jgi:hypothetical protein
LVVELVEALTNLQMSQAAAAVEAESKHSHLNYCLRERTQSRLEAVVQVVVQAFAASVHPVVIHFLETLLVLVVAVADLLPKLVELEGLVVEEDKVNLVQLV